MPTPQKRAIVREEKSIAGYAADSRVISQATSIAAEAKGIDTWLIDLDNTIYPATVDLFPQFDARVRDYIVRLLNVSADEAAGLQKKIWDEYGNSLRGLMALYNCVPHDFIAHIHDIDLSSIDASPVLDRLLSRLPGRKLIFTSGSALHAERVTDRLGVRHHFDGMFDIVASGFMAKPEMSVYQQLVKRYDFNPARAIMIDDVASNLAPAHQLGMHTVWVRPEPHGSAALKGDHTHIDHETDDLIRFLQNWLKD